MKIVVALDGSAYSSKVARYIVKFVGQLKGHPAITLLFVDEPLLPQAARALGPAFMKNYYQSDFTNALKSARSALKRAGIPHDVALRIGKAGETIADFARKQGFDLVVMGSHGFGALQGLFVGSVTTRVLALSSVPVLVVR